MSADALIVRCPRCGTKNRVPANRWGAPAVCGKCKVPMDLSSLYPDRPLDISDDMFRREVLGFHGPVLLEFYSPR
jgi:thioredoxin 2